MIYGILLIVLSLVAVPSLILDKKPNAKELLNKIAPYQGWAGIVFCFWGIWGIIASLIGISLLFSGLGGMIAWILNLLASVVSLGLGFVLGYGLIARYAFKSEETKAKGDAILQKLLPLQKTLAIVGIIVGLIVITFHLIIYPMLVVAVVAAS